MAAARHPGATARRHCQVAVQRRGIRVPRPGATARRRCSGAASGWARPGGGAAARHPGGHGPGGTARRRCSGGAAARQRVEAWAAAELRALTRHVGSARPAAIGSAPAGAVGPPPEECMAHVLGIDIGGSGVKGAPVDTPTGRLMAERQKLATPQPATPEAIANVVGSLCVLRLDWPGGHHFPCVVVEGVMRPPPTSTRLDRHRCRRAFGSEGQARRHANDADAAGVAEMRFSAGHGVNGSCCW